MYLAVRRGGPLQLEFDEQDLLALACDVQHRLLAAAFPKETVVELFTEILSFRDVRISRLYLQLPDTAYPWRGRDILPGDGVRRVDASGGGRHFRSRRRTQFVNRTLVLATCDVMPRLW